MKALILVDVQPDFMPNGNLPIPGGDSIVPVINRLQPHFELVIATQDWHPQNHISFAINHEGLNAFDSIKIGDLDQTLWPAHCVQNTSGAALHKDLDTHQIEAIFRKGTDQAIDSYSAFYDNAHLRSTGLTGYLKDKAANELYFCGLAADICVYFSIQDALEEGFKCVVILDAVKALDEALFDKQRAELEVKGVRFISEAHFL